MNYYAKWYPRLASTPLLATCASIEEAYDTARRERSAGDIAISGDFIPKITRIVIVRKNGDTTEYDPSKWTVDQINFMEGIA